MAVFNFAARAGRYHPMKVLPKIRRLVHEDETHLIDLTSHFFKRFFDIEFVSKDSEVHLDVVHIIALLATPGIFYTFYAAPTYGYIYWNYSRALLAAVSTSDQCRYVLFSMVAVGMVAVVEWDRLFPDARDYAILMPLPLKLKNIFTAKIAALLLFVGLFMVAAAGIPTVFYPMVEAGGTPQGGPSGHLVWLIAAHGIAVFSGCLFMFLLFVALQGALITLLSYGQFKRISMYVQGFATIFLVCQFFLLPLIPQLLPTWEKGHSPALYALPPMWFLGLYRALLGSHNALFLSLARIAAIAFVLTAVVTVVTYLACYRRHAQMAFEFSEEKKPSRLGLGNLTTRLLNRLWLKAGRERATFYFVLKTLDRNSRHRLYFVACVAVGTAFALLGILEVGARPNQALLSIPLFVSFFTVVGMRIAFSFPVELPANWIFQVTERNNGEECVSGVRKAMIALAIIPLFTVVLIAYSVLWGLVMSLLTALFGALLALILVELFLFSYHKIPFTCSRVPGKLNLPLTGALYWFLFTVYAYSMASLEEWMFGHPLRWIVPLAVEAVILNRMAAHRRQALAAGPGIEYEEEPLTTVISLDLNA